MRGIWNLPEFEKIRAENRKHGDQARLMADDGESPEPGKVYTVSPCFRAGDRSWTDAFWEAISQSGPNMLVKIHERHREPFMMLFRVDERAWYPADEAFQLWQAEKTEPKGTDIR